MNKEEIKKLANIVENSAINGYKAIIHSFFNENKENNKNEIVLNRDKCIGFHNGEYLYYPKRLFKVDNVLSLESDIEKCLVIAFKLILNTAALPLSSSA